MRAVDSSSPIGRELRASQESEMTAAWKWVVEFYQLQHDLINKLTLLQQRDTIELKYFSNLLQQKLAQHKFVLNEKRN